MVRLGSNTAFKHDRIKDRYWTEHGTPTKVRPCQLLALVGGILHDGCSGLTPFLSRRR